MMAPARRVGHANRGRDRGADALFAGSHAAVTIQASETIAQTCGAMGRLAKGMHTSTVQQ